MGNDMAPARVDDALTPPELGSTNLRMTPVETAREYADLRPQPILWDDRPRPDRRKSHLSLREAGHGDSFQAAPARRDDHLGRLCQRYGS